MVDLSFLNSSADGLDLSIAKDRNIFRSRAYEVLEEASLMAIREWIPSAPRDRAGAMRVVANTYISSAAH